MAINIFQGGPKSTRKTSKANAASNSVRAASARAALTTPSVTSDSGNTAVGKKSTLSKVGNFVGKAAGIASKFLPGIGGTIAKGIANIFNDPEWWQAVPGDAVTLNAPLRDVETGNHAKLRITMGEFVSMATLGDRVMSVTDTQVTQYLMPEIRKVVNAVPLQAASDYAAALVNNATLYAMWQTLKKFHFLLLHGQTYIANLDDPLFEMLRVANASQLVSMIGRIEEYLRSNVRLPHTLCEYLAWRFGRIYKSNTSAKSGLIMYNAYSIQGSLANWQTQISALMAANSATTALQQANADLFNAYYDHDQAVEIADDTQFKYDVKEFCLRSNCDVRGYTPVTDPEDRDCVIIDSALDNPTTFMASTVSTVGIDAAGAISWLFPVKTLYVYVPKPVIASLAGNNYYLHTAQGGTGAFAFLNGISTSNWCYGNVVEYYPTGTTEKNEFATHVLSMALFCKALDIYNKDVCIRWFRGSLQYSDGDYMVDVTSISMDMGLVPNTVLGNEHVYAFANLVYAGRKHSMSYKEAETLVSRDTANLVEKLDIATAK